MEIFEAFSNTNPDDPAGFMAGQKPTLFEIQANGNLDDKGNDRLTRAR